MLSLFLRFLSLAISRHAHNTMEASDQRQFLSPVLIIEGLAQVDLPSDFPQNRSAIS